MTNVDLDMHELVEFTADMTRVPGELARHAIPVMKKGAHNIKVAMQKDLREGSSRSQGSAATALTISYDDITTSADTFETQIGPEVKDGSLANILYFGSVKGGATVRDPREALEEEAPRFEKAIEDLAESLWP